MSDNLDIQFKKRILPNFISNIIYFSISLLVGIFLAPYFIDTLGYSAYGLIPLATSLTTYVTWITDAISLPISRYLTIDLQQAKIKNAQITYNTAIFGTLAIILVFIPFAILLAIISPSLFDIGNCNPEDVSLLFLLIFLSVLIRVWSNNFMIVLFAFNRLDQRNLINSTNLLIQIVLIVVLFTLLGPSLEYVGYAYLTSAIIALAISIYLSKKTASYLKISPSNFSIKSFVEMMKVTSWTLVDQFGWLLSANVALAVTNILFGDVAGSDYSLVQLWATMILSIGSLFTNLTTPKIYSHYSSQDISGLIDFSKLSMKLSGLIIAPIIALICLYSPTIIELWLGIEYQYLSTLFWLLVFPTILRVLISPIGSLGIVFLKYKIPSCSGLLSGFMNIILVYVFSITTNMGIYGVALAGLISLTTHVGIVCPLYYGYIVNKQPGCFIRTMYSVVFYQICIVIGGVLLQQMIPPSSLFSVLLSGGIIAIAYIIICTHIILSQKERDLIRTILPNTLVKKIPRWIL